MNRYLKLKQFLKDLNIYLNFHAFAGAMCFVVYISLILEKYEKLNTEFFLKISSAVCIYLVGFAIYEILSEVAISAYKYNNNNFLVDCYSLCRLDNDSSLCVVIKINEDKFCYKINCSYEEFNSSVTKYEEALKIDSTKLEEEIKIPSTYNKLWEGDVFLDISKEKGLL